MAILQDMTAADRAELQALRDQNAKLRAKLEAKQQAKVWVRANRLGSKDSQGNPCKGTVSVGGMGRFPVTLYPNQWAKLETVMAEVKACIEENRDDLSFSKED